MDWIFLLSSIFFFFLFFDLSIFFLCPSLFFLYYLSVLSLFYPFIFLVPIFGIRAYPYWPQQMPPLSGEQQEGRGSRNCSRGVGSERNWRMVGMFIWMDDLLGNKNYSTEFLFNWLRSQRFSYFKKQWRKGS